MLFPLSSHQFSCASLRNNLKFQSNLKLTLPYSPGEKIWLHQSLLHPPGQSAWSRGESLIPIRFMWGLFLTLMKRQVFFLLRLVKLDRISQEQWLTNLLHSKSQGEFLKHLLLRWQPISSKSEFLVYKICPSVVFTDSPGNSSWQSVLKNCGPENSDSLTSVWVRIPGGFGKIQVVWPNHTIWVSFSLGVAGWDWDFVVLLIA